MNFSMTTSLPNQNITPSLSNGSKTVSVRPPIRFKSSNMSPFKLQTNLKTHHMISFSAQSQNSRQSNTRVTTESSNESKIYSVKFQTLGDCKLGISRYPDFDYDAQGGLGMATGMKNSSGKISVNFDLATIYIPPLYSATTRFLGLPWPPFLKIDIVPEQFQGTIDERTGEVHLEFKAKFLFSIGSIYRAPALLVATVLTSEESRGTIKAGKGERLDGNGKCRLVGVAKVDPIDDIFMNSFLGLPTECLADLNANISISATS